MIEYLPLFAKGLGYTLFICTSAIIFGGTLGGVLYILSTMKNIVCQTIYRVYILIFRGTPLLVQVYLVYYGGPSVGIMLSATVVGILGLSLYAAAYFAEIYRSGFNHIPKGQIESATDIGLSRAQILFHIQIPQIFGIILPPMTNQAIILIKESAILSIISVPELMTAAIKTAVETFDVVQSYLILALIYWLITFLVSRLGIWAEKRTTYYLQRA